MGDGGAGDQPQTSVAAPPRPSMFRALFQAIRDRFQATPAGRAMFKLLVALFGLAVVIVGLLLVPLPGPGWLIVFAGVAIWAIEFVWARHLLRLTRQWMHRWNLWMKRQRRIVRIPLLIVLVAIVLVVLWLSARQALGFDAIEWIFSGGSRS